MPMTQDNANNHVNCGVYANYAGASYHSSILMAMIMPVYNNDCKWV